MLAVVCLLYACIMLLYACLYVDMMYACSLFVTHTDIFSPVPSGGVTLTGTAGHLLTRRLFLANISPLCMRRVPGSCPRLGFPSAVQIAGG